MQTLSPPRINKATKLTARIQRGGKAGSVPSHKPYTISRCGKLPVSKEPYKLKQVFTGDRIELPLHALEELGGFLDRPRQLLLVLHQHVAVRLLQRQAGPADYLRATPLQKHRMRRIESICQSMTDHELVELRVSARRLAPPPAWPRLCVQLRRHGREPIRHIRRRADLRSTNP
jgi:hypothetical protein